jgi:hypothetical protein
VPGGSATSRLLAGGPIGGRAALSGDREVRQTSGEASDADISGSSPTATGSVPRYSPSGTSSETGAVADSTTVVEQSTGSGGALAGGEAGPQPGAIEPAASGGQFARQSREGPPVRIAAREGAGGLAELQPGLVGLPSRRARPESDVVHTVESRLILEKHGGEARIEAPVAETAVPGFKQRDSASRQKVAEAFGGTPGTERAVELGLAFLARHQEADGSWSLHGFAEGRGDGYRRAGAGQMQTNTAGTGLALLAFLGAGYTHTDGKYREVVSRGLDFLVRNQKEDGDLFGGGSRYCWLYSHGIAAIALGEAYGMTRDERMRGPAQKALDFIAASQNPEDGGWRYRPRYDTDTSVSGWQVMALKSGELAGLTIGPECYARIEKWLNTAQSPITPALYVYRPGAAQAHQRQASRAMTAEAMLMRQYLGWERANPRLVEGATYLRQNLPDYGDERDPRRDAYYWYYATQVMFQMQGDYWSDWNNRLRTLLTTSQEQTGPLAGSWDPMGPTIADRWGNAGGRIYVTTLHLLMLEVYYRHLPLYQTLE